MKIVVMGAGVIGVTSAWYLARAGHEVTVLERNAGPAQETSFGNGGQISVSHAEPWANPAAPLKILRWLRREDAPLLFRLRADPAQWLWALKFLRQCSSARTRANTVQLVRLGSYSRQCLQALRAETGIDYDHLERGILHFYTRASEFDAAQSTASLMRDLGCERRNIDVDEAVRLEPALASVRAQLVGATFTKADESGDARLFTTRLAQACAEAGARFRYGTRITRLLKSGGDMQGVEFADEQGAYQIAKADAYVLALGSYSRAIARSADLSLDLYPVKGYSITLPILQASHAPTVSLGDDEYKLVYSRFGNRLRVAGTAEFNGYSNALNRVRCDAIVNRAMQIFPGISRPELASYWAGLRPTTPGNLPYIGRSALRGLYLNTGHGTLGWTHACGSAQAIADIIDGRRPDVDYAFQGAA